jgi:hypothetical protein
MQPTPVWLRRKTDSGTWKNNNVNHLDYVHNTRTEQVVFNIVDMDYPYNAIIGRGTLNAFEAILHPTYLCMKIPSDQGPVVVHGSQEAARKAEGNGDQPRKIYCLFCGEDKGHTTRMCQITILKQKEIAKAEARQNQPKQVIHTASCHSPYIPEYVGNQPAASVALASHLQASWSQLPPPPPVQPTYSRSQQPEGHRHSQQQRDFRE